MSAALLDPTQWIGRKVAGRYRVVQEISRGGMGAVFLAVQEPLERKVALKIMLPGPAADAGSRRRFIQEAQALSRIPHRNIVTIFDFGEVDGGSLFIAMENVEGRNLRELLREQGTLPWQDSIPVVIGMGRALSIAHASQILHRDLKPENVMLVGGRCATDDVRLLDFGLARTLDASEQLTQVNAIPGTPNYIAPERVVSRTEDPRSDLYSMGAIWFELLTGRLPFGGETMAAILLAHIQKELPTFADVGASAAPPEIEELVRRLMAKRPEDRWATVDTFLEELMLVGEVLVGAAKFGRATDRPMGAHSLDPGPSPDAARPAAADPAPRAMGAAPAPPRAAPSARKTPPPPASSRWTTSSASNAAVERVRFAGAGEGAAAAVLAPPKASADPPAAVVVERKSVIAGRTSSVSVGKETLTIQTEWSETKRAFVTVAIFKGRVLRRRETPVPSECSDADLQPRMEAAHGWFASELKELMRSVPSKEQVASHAQVFFLAVTAYQRGDKATALRTLESLVVELPQDRRLKNSHLKLLLEMEE